MRRERHARENCDVDCDMVAASEDLNKVHCNRIERVIL
jgi:hypothetical protein